MHQPDTRFGSSTARAHSGINRRKLLQRAAAAGLGLSAMGAPAVTWAKKDTVQIRLATDWTTEERGAILKQAVAEFERKYPQYSVKVEPIGGDYYDSLSVQLAGGTAADVMLFSGAFFVNFQQQGAFADLTPYLKKYNVDMAQYPAEPAVFRSGSQRFAMPFQLTITTWYANIDMFEAANVPLPKDGWTWDEMLETAQKLTIPDKKQWGIWMPNDPESHWGPLVLSAGGNWMNADKTKTALADGHGFDGFKLAVELVTKYKVSPTPAQTVGLATAATDSPFAAGRTAMTPANSSAVGNFTSVVGDRFRWQPIPQPVYAPTRGLRTTFNDQPHVVNAHAKDLDGAALLAIFMAGDFVQGLIAEKRGSTPVVKDLQQSKQYLAAPPANMAQIGKNLTFAEDLGFTRNWLEWFRAITSAADPAFIGEQSAEDAFQKVIAAGDKVLAQK